MILDKALKVFAKKGFDATKMADLSKIIGISQGLIYHYFPSKEELFNTLVKRATDISARALRSIANMQASPREKIEALSRRMVQLAATDEVAVNNFMLMIQVGMRNGFNEQVQAYDSTPVRMLKEIIEEGQRCGQVVMGDPIRLTYLYWACVEGICVNKITHGNQFPIPEAQQLNRLLLV